jgi:hypothetical protein
MSRHDKLSMLNRYRAESPSISRLEARERAWALTARS